jgi:hypothetical protein
MEKLSLLFTLVLFLGIVPILGQQKSRIQPIGPPVKQMLSVEDQTGDGYILFDITTGNFKCSMCEYGYDFSGTGQVKIDGFNVYLSAVSDSYQLFVSLNVWDKQGKAVMEIFQSPNGQLDIPPIQEFWTDLNISDNSLLCVKK